jgi:hypothetical protein
MTAHTTPSPARSPRTCAGTGSGCTTIISARTSWLLIFLGAVLEDADARERASVLTAMPVLPRLIWQTAGRVLYARYTRRVRGRPYRPAAS